MTSHHPNLGGPSHQIITDTARIVGVLQEYAEQIHQTGDLNVVALPPALANIVDYVQSRGVRVDLEHMQEAWAIVNDDTPMLGALPISNVRANESPRRWRGPLTPWEILKYARKATPGEQGYRHHLAANQAFHDERSRRTELRLTTLCGRNTTTGRPCRGMAVYVPADRSGAIAEGWPCHLHATNDEARALEATYTAAVAEHDCPGCDATAGQPCWVGDDVGPHLRLIDGEWARPRSYRGQSVHDARLVLTLPTS